MLTLLVLSTAAPRAAPLDVSRARLARRDILGCGSAIGIAAAANAVPPPKTNVTEALEKNKVVVRRQELLTEVVIDPKTGDELREIQLPAGYPKSLRPPRLVERRVSEAELALAAVVAGGTTEIARVAALHPLATLKSRAQARPGTGPLDLIDATKEGTAQVKTPFPGLGIMQELLDSFRHAHTPTAIATRSPGTRNAGFAYGNAKMRFVLKQVVGGP